MIGDVYQDYVHIFNDSFERCAKEPLFLDNFYRIFFASSDEVKEKFKHTDMVKQKKILLASMSFLMIAHRIPEVLDDMATKHDQSHLNIPPHLYELWLESMISAVKLTDSEYSGAIEIAWRALMQPGIDYMIDKYNASAVSA